MGWCRSHMIWEVAVMREKTATCLDVDMDIHPTLRPLKIKTEKAERTQRQVISRTGVPWSPIPVKYADSIRHIHNLLNCDKRAYGSMALVDDSKSGIWGALQLFLISVCSCTLSMLPSLTMPELSAARFSLNKLYRSLCSNHYTCVLSAYRAEFLMTVSHTLLASFSFRPSFLS